MYFISTLPKLGQAFNSMSEYFINLQIFPLHLAVMECKVKLYNWIVCFYILSLNFGS